MSAEKQWPITKGRQKVILNTCTQRQKKKLESFCKKRQKHLSATAASLRTLAVLYSYLH